MSTTKSRVSRSSNKRLPKTASSASSAAELASDGPHCIICAEKIIFSAISPCNNVTCHICSFRQRALYKRKTCLVCRTEHEDVIFADDTLDEAKYGDYEAASRALFSPEYGVHYTTRKVKEDTLALLKTQCTVCQAMFPKNSTLNEHVKSEHGKYYCDICLGHGNSFLTELTLFTQKQLQRHMNEGDKDGFKGHPKCKFCRNQRFFSEDELNVHIRDRHERCHICNVDNYNASDYFRNYDDLYNHFRSSHYVCSVPVCVEKRFVVFREDLDLTAHMLKEHGGIAGPNGRIVIGATSTNFQSHLSTYRPRQQATNQQENSLALKRRRLDERAKHYLYNDKEKLADFHKCNACFKSRQISADALLEQYKDIFKDNDMQEISLLVYELAELQPLHSEQRTQLQQALDRLDVSRDPNAVVNQNFPLLAGSSSALTLRSSSWGAGAVNARKTQEELFPVLTKPKKSNQNVVSNGPIRYTVIKKKPEVAEKPQVTSKPFKENTQYRPTYLEHKNSESNLLPRLGSSSNSDSSTLGSSRDGSRAQSPVSGGTFASLPESKFPPLAAKKKPAFAPVKPVNKGPAKWAQGLVPSTEEPTDDWGIPIIDKKAEKLRRKQEKANLRTNSKH